MPADDLTDPAPATTFAHLDATTVLSRALTELGIYPAVDPLDSTSRILDPIMLGERYPTELIINFLKDITRSLDLSKKSSKIINHSKILLPFLVWMNCQKKIS